MKSILDMVTGRYWKQFWQHMVKGKHTFEEPHMGYVQCTNEYCDAYYYIPIDFKAIEKELK